MKKLLFAMMIGAALAWLLDPDSGSRRREMLRKRLDDRGVGQSSDRSVSSFDDNRFSGSGGGSVTPPIASVP